MIYIFYCNFFVIHIYCYYISVYVSNLGEIFVGWGARIDRNKILGLIHDQWVRSELPSKARGPIYSSLQVQLHESNFCRCGIQTILSSGQLKAPHPQMYVRMPPLQDSITLHHSAWSATLRFRVLQAAAQARAAPHKGRAALRVEWRMMPGGGRPNMGWVGNHPGP
jgi:hypothetical protein